MQDCDLIETIIFFSSYFWAGACNHRGLDDPCHASGQASLHTQQEEEEEVIQIMMSDMVLIMPDAQMWH